MKAKAIALSLLITLALASTALVNVSADSKSPGKKHSQKKIGNKPVNSNNDRSSQQDDTKPMEKVSNINVDSRLVTADTKFGFNLYSQLSKQGADKNIFISPASIAMALAMTCNGASGETRQAMMHALELQGLTPSE